MVNLRETPNMKTKRYIQQAHNGTYEKNPTKKLIQVRVGKSSLL